MQKDIHPDDIAQFGLNIYQYGHEVCARSTPTARQCASTIFYIM